MKLKRHPVLTLLLLLVIVSLGIAGCEVKTPSLTQTPQPDTPTGSPTATQTIQIPPSPTSVPPTPTSTPEPLAAIVNGEGILLSTFETQYQLYQQAAVQAGTNLATEEAEARQRVLAELIDQTLLAQAAFENGFMMDDATLQTRIEELANQAGGPQALQDWLAAYAYPESRFREDLRRAAAAAWMRDQVIASLAETAEQVHARQILLYNLDQANQVFAQLQSGQDFNDLAARYDPIAAGDIGWFPRGYLSQLSLEEAAFSMQPGAFSSVIQTELGYHILYVIEHDPQRPLDPDARMALQAAQLANWMQARRNQGQIQILLP